MPNPNAAPRDDMYAGFDDIRAAVPSSLRDEYDAGDPFDILGEGGMTADHAVTDWVQPVQGGDYGFPAIEPGADSVPYSHASDYGGYSAGAGRQSYGAVQQTYPGYAPEPVRRSHEQQPRIPAFIEKLRSPNPEFTQRDAADNLLFSLRVVRGENPDFGPHRAAVDDAESALVRLAESFPPDGKGAPSHWQELNYQQAVIARDALYRVDQSIRGRLGEQVYGPTLDYVPPELVSPNALVVNHLSQMMAVNRGPDAA